MSGDANQKSLVFRINRRVGSIPGWIGITIGLFMIGGGIAGLILKDSLSLAATAPSTTTSALTISTLSTILTPSTVLIGSIVFMVVGMAMIAAIIILPTVIKHYKNKRTADLAEEIKDSEVNHLERSLESARLESARQAAAKEREQEIQRRQDAQTDSEDKAKGQTATTEGKKGQYKPVFKPALRRSSKSELEPGAYEEVSSGDSPAESPRKY